MNFKRIAFAGAAAFALAACGQDASGDAATQEAAASEASASSEAASAQQEADTVEYDAPSGVYSPDDGHRYIVFSYLHQGYSRPILRWDDWTGELDWNAEAPADSSVSIAIDAESINSGVEEFDGHLKGERFFDVANYPEITFVSTEVEKTGADTGTITGELTIKGATRPVTLDVTFRKGAYDERNNIYKLGFSGATTVMRSDFGVGAFVPVVSDEVDITIETEWEMPAPESE
ncbi:YceI family protein [Hyphococcus luteus]|nr:YceI family protein [Marinicaulis flavus]